MNAAELGRTLVIDATLRVYLVAHAPAEPWPEFSPTMSTTLPELTPDTSDRGERRRIEELRRLQWFNARDLARRIQWPAYWADRMLEELAE